MPQKTESLVHVCVIGSGPAGYYATEALAQEPHVRIDVIDKLPTPYGLIRGGVAPDHQSIKGVYRRYEKTALGQTVHFVGNLEIGKDITLAELKELYDAVILATGAPKDRTLGIPGDDKEGVIGSAAFVGWYNSHPEFADLNPDLDVTSVVVIGNGNVAVDVARVLAKTPVEMAESDLAPYAAAKIYKSPIKDIWMLGRRGALEAKFTPKELGELNQLENCVALTDVEDLPPLSEEELAALEPATKKNMGHLYEMAKNRFDANKKTFHIKFYAMPVEILGEDKIAAIRLEKTIVDESGKCVGTGETFDIDCQMVIPCIGYYSLPIEGAAFNEARGIYINTDGVIADGLYVTGWARRGPTGTIGTNRTDAQEVAAKVLETVKPSDKHGYSGLKKLIQERNLEVVTFAGWKKIEQAEEKAAQGKQPRTKFHRIEDMLKAAKS